MTSTALLADTLLRMISRRCSTRPLALVAVAALVVAPACSEDDEPDDALPLPTETTATANPDEEGAEGLEVVPGVVAELQPSVVTVLAGGSQGSGVVYDEDGTIVTNVHVVGGLDTAEVALVSGERLEAEVVARDQGSDLAVLRVEDEDLPAPRFAEELPRVGELAIAMGNPLGFENSVTAGIVSGLARSIPGAARSAPALIDLVQTDAAISPGNSGGALVDGDGRVIGINVAYLPPNPLGGPGAVSIGFAIPAPTVLDVVEQLLDDGDVSYSYLGIRPQPLTPEIARQFGFDRTSGVLVADVVDDSPAANAGLEPGDLLIGLDGEALSTVEDLLAALRQFDPGDEVILDLVRNGEGQLLEVTLAGAAGEVVG